MCQEDRGQSSSGLKIEEDCVSMAVLNGKGRHKHNVGESTMSWRPQKNKFSSLLPCLSLT